MCPLPNEIQMVTDIKTEEGTGHYEKKCLAVKLWHSSADLQLLITETEDGFKVVESGSNKSRLSVRPSSSNSIIIES